MPRGTTAFQHNSGGKAQGGSARKTAFLLGEKPDNQT
jgi:hypothetical protein